jgi:hypothetical protein
MLLLCALDAGYINIYIYWQDVPKGLPDDLQEDDHGDEAHVVRMHGYVVTSSNG